MTKLDVDRRAEVVAKAANLWRAMGLSTEQIAFGIAVMNAEFNFDATAKASTSAHGLGQFTDTTWSDAIKL